MESKNPTQSSSDEIDLLDLLAKVVLIIKRSIVLIITSFIIGSLLGFGYFTYAPRVFKSKMLISSDILTESYSKSLIDNLDNLVKDKNFQSLSAKLNLSLDHASDIKEIAIKSALGKPDNIPETNKVYLTIEAGVHDNSLWPQLQFGLISYLENNEFVKIRVAQRKKFYTKIIEKIDLELADLEKLKAKIADGSWTSSNKDNLVLLDPTKINSTIIDLNKERIHSQNALEIGNSVQVVEGFTVFNKPTSPKLSISLVSGASLGLFLAILFVAFKYVRSIVKLSEESLAKS